ncbi:amino acid ABC transporter ATP-binding protein [Neorhizobium sp. JUb45]|uniref:ABC transporter ATP-binding protein n=1 Tax=Neorhizobium sp. JUb45 TaxID=2485113 RepID=UPI00105118DA|nr:amino acid ABC transporter ATP-binding protein [Neorhizobium sp. JUb45]TCQ98021.1 L-histidine ABC transporter ATP-binding protein /L-arginine ABC transporter ATP-binding protein /L-lysine ABC transporter ATP-binding protein /L-ornithine ABC transporter ATP-binding protein [Neorhizobium sp. JUb45]
MTIDSRGRLQSTQDFRTTALRVVNLKKQYGPVEVLTGLSLTAQRGEVISILGSSGSGKSTFLRCLNFLEEPTSGEIWVGDHHVSMARGNAKRRQINALRTSLGMVFQNFNLWPAKTVLENIVEAPIHVLGLSRRAANERALSLLEKVGLASHRSAYPAHLSGGQQQRIAIARTLAMEPEILLFDEPTSALDPELVGEVLKVIRALAEEGRTMLIVTHELGFARQVSHRVVFLHAGQIEEEGRPEQFFRQPSSPRLAQFLSSHLQEPDR